MAPKNVSQENESSGFDPSSMAVADSGIFGLQCSADQAKLHIIPVPWETTTSYGRGAGLGPSAVLRASHQVDLYDFDTGEAWKAGYFMDEISEEWSQRGRDLKEKAQERLEFLETAETTPAEEAIRDEINAASEELNEWVASIAAKKLKSGKLVGLLGGDHSTPFGLIKAISEHVKGDFGILHIDAHADLRVSYQGYENSHASIMYNVIEKIRPRILVQVGIRDFSRDERAYSESRRQKDGSIGSGRIVTHYDRGLKMRMQAGETYASIAKSIVSDLPNNVYVSFDIDGLEPDLCPNTGTPVPGGLSFDQAASLLAAIVESGRKIIGFDLNEVAEPEPGIGEWDANVGARMLFKLCGWAMISNGLADKPV